MFCTNCGSALGGSSAFCTSCGAAVAAAAGAPAPTKPKKTKPSAEPITSIDSAPAESSDPYKPAGMSHAEYAYQGIPASSPRKTSNGARVGIILGVLAIGALLAGGGIALSSNMAKDSLSSQDSSASDWNANGGMATDVLEEDVAVDPATGDPDQVVDPAPANWPPGDYYEYSSSLAYRWDESNAESTCDSCSYWMLDVITNLDCSVLTVTMDVTDSNDDIVDTIKGTAYGVRAGGPLLVELNTWADDPQSGDITNMTCG